MDNRGKPSVGLMLVDVERIEPGFLAIDVEEGNVSHCQFETLLKARVTAVEIGLEL